MLVQGDSDTFCFAFSSTAFFPSYNQINSQAQSIQFICAEASGEDNGRATGMLPAAEGIGGNTAISNKPSNVMPVLILSHSTCPWDTVWGGEVFVKLDN